MKSIRFHVCLILSAVFVFLLLPSRGQAAQETVPEGWTGIYTRSDLEKVTLNPDGKYLLMNDIDLSGNAFKPLCSEDLPFAGVFDGNGKTLYGLTASVSQGASGLFSYISHGTVKNLSVSGTSTGPIAGILAGKMGTGTLTNCTVRGTATAAFCGGGLVGQVYGNGTLSECVSYATVSSTGTAENEVLLGGITGAVYGTGNELSKCSFFGALSFSGPLASAGGIAGDLDGEAVVSQCISEGTLSLACSDFAAVGGIVGRTGRSAASLIDCSFAGDWNVPSCAGRLHLGGIAGQIYALQTVTLSGGVSHGSLSTAAATSSVGGIVGSSIAAGGSVTVSKCQSYAALTGVGCPLALGGICGTNRGDSGVARIEDCYASGSVTHTQPINGDTSLAFGGIVGVNGGNATSTVIRCFSVCEVKVTYPMGNGAVVGMNFEGTAQAASSVTQCYYRQGETEHFALPVSGDGLTKASSFAGFDFAQTWTIDSSVGMPVLRNPPQTVSYPVGDVDGNGRVTEYDANLLTQYLTGRVTLTQQQRIRGDYNGDGVLNARDTALILRNAH